MFMAGCSNSGNGFGSGYLGGGNGLQSNGCGLKIDHVVDGGIRAFDEFEVKKRSLFDLFLSCFWNEFAARDSIRPIPVMLDEKPVDLFRLFMVVREKGGYDLVSKDRIWGFVAKELGLDLKVSASVKLVYCKYLNEVEKWLRDGFGEGKSENRGNLGFLSLDLEKKFRALFANGMDRAVMGNGLTPLKHKATSKCISKDANGNELNPSISGKQNLCKRFRDDDEKVCKNNPVIVDRTGAENDVSSRKRKKLNFSDMLNWVTQIAKNPRDPTVGAIPEPSKWKEHQGNENWIQVVRAREALMQKVHSRPIPDQPLLQDKQKMHPAMYEDDLLVHNSSERSRTSTRIATSTKTCPCSCCKPRPASEKVASPKKEPQVVVLPSTKKEPQVVVLPSSTKAARKSEEVFFDKHVSVGPSFQAEVPGWYDKVLDSDDKWLGTLIWPLESRDSEVDYIGRGKIQSCDCIAPGSVECVRFHIAENRMKLKLELGPVFYHWRFDRMGEEVSLRWTELEEKRFKRMLLSAAQSLDTRFWTNASKYFRGKTREDLVSYYFNVFGIQRRSYQNRVTPRDIDSDNDEEEFGSISQGFGLDALKVPGSGKLVCSQNYQCFDLP